MRRARTNTYRERLLAAGGIDAVFARLAAEERLWHIAKSFNVPRMFLAEELNQDPARLREVYGKPYIGRMVKTKRTAIKIENHTQAVNHLRESIKQVEAWLEKKKQRLAQKEAALEFLKGETAKKPAPKAIAIHAELSRPTKPKWQPIALAELEPATAPESVPKPAATPEPELRISVSRLDTGTVERTLTFRSTPREPEPEPPPSMAELNRRRAEPVKERRVPKSKMIRVLRLDKL